MKQTFVAAGLLALMMFGTTCADPAVPWAQPQTFPDQPDTSSEKPLFERVMEEERRRKEQGIKETVTVDDLNANSQRAKPAVSAVPVKPTEQPILQPQEFKTLERGAQGKQVEELQKTLIDLGFGLPAGADGDYGGQTVLAVQAFQSSVDLPLTGKFDEATHVALTRVRPAKGKKVWEDRKASLCVAPVPILSGKKARVLIDLSEHRLFVYDGKGALQRVFPVASGSKEMPTDPGVKVVCEKMEDPTKLAEKLWPESKGTAFGKRLIDLNWFNVDTGVQTVSDEELHGTYELQSIGKNASHGCVRLTNESIEWLYQNLVIGDLVLIRE